jgi:hypothetical protein
MRLPQTTEDLGQPRAGAGGTPDVPNPAAAPATGPLALWLAIQLAVVTLAVLRVPLAAQYPEPAERMAAHLVLGAQGVTAALLFPFLFRDTRTAAAVIAAAWPFQLAAGFLAGIAPADLASAAGYVTVWMLTLAACTPLLRTPRASAIGITIATLLTLGGAILRYLRLEFGGGVAEGQFTPESVSPLLSTFAAIEGSGPHSGWMLVAGVLCVAALTIGARRILSSRARRRPPTGIAS